MFFCLISLLKSSGCHCTPRQNNLSFLSTASMLLLYAPVKSVSGVGVLTIFGITQGTFFQFWTPDLLRGFGVGTPNGSLWTICTLIQFYILAVLFYRFIRNKKMYWWIAFFCISVAAGLIAPLLEKIFPEILYKLYNQFILQYFWIFMIGLMIARYREKVIPFMKRFWWLFMGTAILLHVLTVPDFKSPYPLFGSILLIVGSIGFSYAFPKINISYDCSYGIYIYHMVVINVFIQLGFTERYWLIPATVLITVLLSMGSTTIGKRIREHYEK